MPECLWQQTQVLITMQVDPSLNVAFRKSSKSHSDKHRDCRSWSYRKLLPRSQHCIEYAANKISVNTVLWWQSGQCCIRECNRYCISSQGKTGYRVITKKLQRIFRKPGKSRNTIVQPGSERIFIHKGMYRS